nr:HD domain-containing protein [Dissulfurirhabdus thermomarina]
MARSGAAWAAGGPVRDWFLGRPAADLDVVVPEGGVAAARGLAARAGGRLVLLDEGEGVARVVFPDLVVDFSQFRGGARDLAGDLAARDFTLNAMAVPLGAALPLLDAPPEDPGAVRGRLLPALVDPHGGRRDLEAGVIRALGRRNLADDPLRLLRAFRFRAQLDFAIEPGTRGWIPELAPALGGVAAERVSHELGLVLATGRAGRTFAEMAEAGILFVLFPELAPGVGLEQPGFHHLDVFRHCLAALEALEELVRDPGTAFTEAAPLRSWVAGAGDRLPWLAWAALFHDLGKPACRGEKAGRPTFYYHDHAGAEMVAAIGRRLRWPRRGTAFAARMVRLHMRPFFLLAQVRRGGPSRRAMRRLLTEAGADYPALFLLAMADSRAGRGPLKPPDLDRNLDLLWSRVHAFHEERMRPVAALPRLLTGHDLQEIFGLAPGPRIGRLLEALEEARVEGRVADREEAVRWLRRLVEQEEA